jgi:hypothetical protein
MDEPLPVSRSSWWPRFSILTALLLLTIFAMAIVIVELWREVRPLRDELVQLRNETGRLSVDDPTKIYAIEVRTNDPLLWKWRVWVPQGPTVIARNYWGPIPASGMPAVAGSIHLKPGENWVTLRAHPSATGTTWSAYLETEGSSVGMGIQPADRWWDWSTTSSSADGVGYSTSMPARESDRVLVLKRMRVSSVTSSNPSSQSAAKTTGFMAWLERR